MVCIWLLVKKMSKRQKGTTVKIYLRTGNIPLTNWRKTIRKNIRITGQLKLILHDSNILKKE